MATTALKVFMLSVPFAAAVTYTTGNATWNCATCGKATLTVASTGGFGRANGVGMLGEFNIEWGVGVTQPNSVSIHVIKAGGSSSPTCTQGLKRSGNFLASGFPNPLDPCSGPLISGCYAAFCSSSRTTSCINQNEDYWVYLCEYRPPPGSNDLSGDVIAVVGVNAGTPAPTPAPTMRPTSAPTPAPTMRPTAARPGGPMCGGQQCQGKKCLRSKVTGGNGPQGPRQSCDRQNYCDMIVPNNATCCALSANQISNFPYPGQLICMEGDVAAYQAVAADFDGCGTPCVLTAAGAAGVASGVPMLSPRAFISFIVGVLFLAGISL